MSFFGTLILLFLIFFVIIPLFRVVAQVWSLHRRMKKAGRQMNDAFNRARRQSEPRPTVKKKKIDSSVGEYVSFEEISCDVNVSSQTAGNTTRVKVESQIEDAEWEEIK